MAFTSQWVWTKIKRGTQSSVQGTQMFRKRAWTLARYRISDDISVGGLSATSEVDTTQNSLSAYNGGTAQTISCPTTNYVSFTSISADCNFAKTGDKWVENGFTDHGYPIYTSWNTSISPVYSLSAEAMFYLAICPITNGGNYAWGIGALEKSLVDIGVTPTYWGAISAKVYETTGSAATRDADARVLDNPISTWWDGLFKGDATTALTTGGQLGFYCLSDDQEYSHSGVGFYIQKQVWVYEEPFKLVG